MDKNIFQFSAEIFGEITSVNAIFSRARVRIFYKGLNRNYTYITDQFAEKLLQTLPYTPVVGKYRDGDYTNHGNGNEQLQVYGVIPENPNISWERHTDKDGVEREYACADVLLWTARFPEASEIVGKPQSMELYPKSVVGQWVYDRGQKYFKFEEGAFLGVTALGTHTEPCFEGAAFYSYQDSLKELADELKTYNLNLNKGGQTDMDEIKDEVLEEIEVPTEDPTEEPIETPIDEPAEDPIDEPAEDPINELTEEPVEDPVEEPVDEPTEEPVEEPAEGADDFSKKDEDKKNKKENDDDENDNNDDNCNNECKKKKNYEAMYKEEFEKNSALESQIVELNSQIATYKSEAENMQTELTELRAFKLEYENNQVKAEKEEVFAKYEKALPQEILEKYKAKISEYTSASALNTDLAVEFANCKIQAFSLQETEVEMLPGAGYETEYTCTDAADRMLAKFLKNKK